MKNRPFLWLVQTCPTLLLLAALTLISSCASDDLDPFIIQPGQEEIIKKGLDFPYTGSLQLFPIETTEGAEWTYSQEGESLSWLILEPTDGGLHIRCLENTATSPREATVSIVSGSHNMRLKVSQQPKPMLKAEWDDRLIPKEGATVDIPFTCNTKFNINLAYIFGEHNVHWSDKISIDSTGVDKGVLHYGIGPNNGLGRVFMIEFNAGGVTLDRIFIRQAFDNSRLQGNVEVNVPDYYAASEAFREKGLLYTFLGEDNHEGWRKIKTLRLSGNLSWPDLDYLSELVGSHQIAEETNKMEGAHINLDMNWVKGIDEIPRYQFQRAVALDSIALPLTTKAIGDHAFWGCHSLRHVSLRGGEVRKVGVFAFSSCPQLTDLLTDEESPIQEIGRYAFATKSTIEEFYMPWGLKEFDDNSFRNFFAKKIYAPWEDTDELPNVTFFEPVYESSQLIVPKGCTEFYRQSAAWGRFRHITERE